MEIVPQMVAARFEQVEPGGLFIFPFKHGASFALKVTPPERDARPLILPMGPSFPTDEHQPRLLAWQPETTVSLGKRFVFRLDTDPSAWTGRMPPLNYFCCALVESEIFLRANANPFDGYLICWARLSDGALSWKEPPGIVAYSTKWEVLTSNEGILSKPIIRISGEPFGSEHPESGE